MDSFKTIVWEEDRIVMIDQRRLPMEEIYLELRDAESVFQAIRQMAIRGAPAVGVAAAMGIALGAKHLDETEERFFEGLENLWGMFLRARPTAVNLRWAVERMRRVVEKNRGCEARRIKDLLVEEALRIFREDLETNLRIGENGKDLLQDRQTVLTHCNAGALATAGYGTALGVIRSAYRQGKRIHVLADETRPFLQGARLTTWELQKEGIPVTLITDGMAGYFMSMGEVDLVLVGADRIAANGDVANKIGTYSVAVLAREHRIPFYVAAPLSTFDRDTPSGDRIPIEQRDPTEITHWKGERMVPEGVLVRNPAFDITPHSLLTGIITEKGIVRSPYSENIEKMLRIP